MITLSLTILLQMSLVTGDSHKYSDAYHKAQQTGRPLVVLVGADWCPGCQTMKNAVIPQLRQQGSLNRVSFAIVNTEADRELATKLMKGGSIPQLIMYHKTADGGWHREQLTGAHSVDDTQVFLSKADEPSSTRLTSR